MNQQPIATQEESAMMDGVLSQHQKRFEAGAADETRDCGGEPQTALGGGNTEAGMALDRKKASGAPLSNTAPANYIATLSEETGAQALESDCQTHPTRLDGDPEPKEPPDEEVPRLVIRGESFQEQPYEGETFERFARQIQTGFHPNRQA